MELEDIVKNLLRAQGIYHSKLQFTRAYQLIFYNQLFSQDINNRQLFPLNNQKAINTN